ncbi:MAG: bifunctional folylpolyglutamate synthase/dihydrofolate synthase [Chloroflexia bacterium]|nr:bifunctional folylpolyglutamate synthase/dihydrofolate synthase [Chloroflexia bacterium]
MKDRGPDPVEHYQRALAYLYQFADYQKGAYRYSRPEHNLARTEILLAGLGHPEQRYPSLLIAGTKGKGSTAAFLEAMLRAAGRRTGLYTSPHLHSWRERIQVDRRLISQQEVVDWVDYMRPLVADMPQQDRLGPATYFEICTALALGYFASQGVDVAVLEVGLGGRLDSTNVVRPEISLLSRIGYDHMDILGHSLEQIAAEKAAIIKPAGRAITATQDPAALTVIQATAQERGAALWVAQEADLRPVLPQAGPGQHYPVSLDQVELSLRGHFQQGNARLALAAVQVLRGLGWDIPDAAIAAGLQNTHWPLRLEVAGQEPWLVLDAAHNIDSARALRRALGEEFSFERLILVMGLSQGHDVAPFAATVGSGAELVIATSSTHPRSMPAHDFAAAIRPALDAAVEVVEPVSAALQRARTAATADDLICVCGLFVAAEARQACGLAEVVD